MSAFNQPTNKPMSYAESVMSFTDSEGKLNALNIKQLLNEHGFTVADWIADHAARNMHDDLIDDAQTILNWLGY